MQTRKHINESARACTRLKSSLPSVPLRTASSRPRTCYAATLRRPTGSQVVSTPVRGPMRWPSETMQCTALSLVLMIVQRLCGIMIARVVPYSVAQLREAVKVVSVEVL